MKKNFAILLLAIHLVNVCGYRLFFSLAENRADRIMIASIDDNRYNEKDLLQVKLALHSPYLQSKSSFERYDGSVEYNGVQYNYVKRLVRNDTLYLYCIPNNEKTRINAAKNLIAKQNADLPAGKSEQAVWKKINSTNLYSFAFLRFDFKSQAQAPSWTTDLSSGIVLKGFSRSPVQPPDTKFI